LWLHRSPYWGQSTDTRVWMRSRHVDRSRLKERERKIMN
jgi:hypothetical protein